MSTKDDKNWLTSVEDIARQCHFRDTIYIMTKKTVSGVHVHVLPDSAEILVRRGGISKSPFDSILSQRHLCKKLPKSVDVR